MALVAVGRAVRLAGCGATATHQPGKVLQTLAPDVSLT
jgi:hypothetical protein